MTEQEITGRCYCGDVRYRITARLEGAGICYCEDCTRSVGSPVTVWTGVPAARFEFTEGKPTRFTSSPGVTRTFCPRCGTSLSYHGYGGDRVDVAIATLDDPSLIAPTSEGPDGTRPQWMAALENS